MDIGPPTIEDRRALAEVFCQRADACLEEIHKGNVRAILVLSITIDVSPERAKKILDRVAKLAREVNEIDGG